jgi:hypothetical protein
MKKIGLILIIVLLYNTAWAQSSAKDAIRMGQQNAQEARDRRHDLFNQARDRARGPAPPSTPYIIYPDKSTSRKHIHHNHCKDCPEPQVITITPPSEPAWVDSSSSTDSLSWDK